MPLRRTAPVAPRKLPVLALAAGALAAAACSERNAMTEMPRECAAPADRPLFHQVSARQPPDGAAMTIEANAGRLLLTLDGWSFDKTRDLDSSPVELLLDVRVPESCALGALEATLVGDASISNEAEARLVLDLDGAGLTYDWGPTDDAPFEISLERAYQPGFIDPPPAADATARPGEQAYAVVLTLDPRFYGEAGATARIAVARIEIAGTLVPAEG